MGNKKDKNTNRHGIPLHQDKPKPIVPAKKKKHVTMMPKHINSRFKFKPGDIVRVINQSHGWGDVKSNDTGIVSKVCHHGLEVDFKTRKAWFGTFKCFIKAKSLNIKSN